MSWKDKIELEAIVDDETYNSTLSQAISLKRIADALEKLQAPKYQPIMMDAQQYAIYLKNKE